MRLRLVSDGTQEGTQLVEHDTNMPLENVVAFTFEYNMYNAKPYLTVLLSDVEVEVDAETELNSES